MDVDFDPSSYQPMCQGVTKITINETGKQNNGTMEREQPRQAFELGLCDTFTSEDYDALRLLYYMDSAVIALCFSVAKRETFDMIKTRVRRLYSL